MAQKNIYDYWKDQSGMNMNGDPAGDFGQWMSQGGQASYDAYTGAAQAAENQRIANLKAQGLNPDGSPIAPEWQGITDEAGNLQDKYRLDPSTLEGYNMIKAMAQAPLGTSDYAQTAQAQNIFSRQNQMDAAAAQAGAGTRQAIGALASRGGAGSGARERIAGQGALGLLGAKQGAYREAAGRGMDITAREEEMRRGAIDKFATGESGIAQYNLGNLLKDVAGKREFELDKYRTDAERWGAGKQAEATRSAGGGGGGGGCFITTAACEQLGFEDDSAFLNTFRAFRDEHMGGKNSEQLKEYYEIAPKIVEKIGGDKVVYTYIITQWLFPAFEAIKEKNVEKAHAIYAEMVNWLKEKYLEV